MSCPERSSALSHHGRRHRRLRPGRADEAGAALILAIAFLGIVFTSVTILFGFADAGSRSLAAYRGERTLRYASDGALEQAIVVAQNTPAIGVYPTYTPTTCLKVPIVEPSTRRTMTTGSFLSVTCSTTPGTSLPANDSDGLPGVRDVTFTVYCAATPGSGTALPGCGTGATNRTVAVARVQFDIDYSDTPTITGGSTAGRSRVPKVVSWSTPG